MSESPLKPGDKVDHVSGTGPSMVVIEVEGTSVICEWFDHVNELQQKRLSITSIRKASIGI